MATSPRRPLSGPRLNYELQMGGVTYQVRIKESIGSWLGLKPKRPGTGTFGKNDGQLTIPGLGSANHGKKFLRRPAGYEFQSYKFLVKPGTYIVEPEPGCHEGKIRKRLICSFSIGFSKGSKKNPITRWRVNSWLASSSKAKEIIGFITPSGVKHQWEGKLPTGAAKLISDITPDLPSLDLDSIRSIIDAGSTVAGLLF